MRCTVSLLSNLSKMPSHPIIIKSKLSLILKAVMSGSATTTFGFPSNLVNFASISPKVRLTESLPGKTRCGPYMTYYYPLKLGFGWGTTLEF